MYVGIYSIFNLIFQNKYAIKIYVYPFIFTKVILKVCVLCRRRAPISPLQHSQKLMYQNSWTNYVLVQ